VSWVQTFTLTSFSMLVTEPYTNPCNLTSVRVKDDKNLGSGTCSIGKMNCITVQCILYTTYLNASACVCYIIATVL